MSNIYSPDSSPSYLVPLQSLPDVGKFIQGSSLDLNSQQRVLVKNQALYNGTEPFKGRIYCAALAAGHLLSAPLSALISLIQTIAYPLLGAFYATNILFSTTSEKVPRKVERCFSIIQSSISSSLLASVGIVINPLLHINGTIRAVTGIMDPSLYLSNDQNT